MYKDQESAKANPIYIIGVPRSGNTLLGCILNKHPDLFILFEENTFHALRKQWKTRLKQKPKRPEKEIARTFIEEWSNRTHCNTSLDISFEEITQFASEGEPHWGSMLNCFMRYLMSKSKPSAMRWGDKTPHHTAHISRIQSTYPKAQFIYVYRDPLQVVASLSKESFTPAENDVLTNAEVVRHYLSIYQKQKKFVKPNQLLEVKYEELVYTPEQTLKDICNFLEVSYTPALLEPADEYIRQVVGWSDYKGWGEVRSQTTKLPPRFSPLVEAYLSDWLRAFHYKYEQSKLTKYRKILATVRLLPFRMTRELLNVFWKFKYPDCGDYLMLKFPPLRHYVRWLRAVIPI